MRWSHMTHVTGQERSRHKRLWRLSSLKTCSCCLPVDNRLSGSSTSLTAKRLQLRQQLRLEQNSLHSGMLVANGMRFSMMVIKLMDMWVSTSVMELIICISMAKFKVWRDVLCCDVHRAVRASVDVLSLHRARSFEFFRTFWNFLDFFRGVGTFSVRHTSHKMNPATRHPASFFLKMKQWNLRKTDGFLFVFVRNQHRG